MSTCISGLSCTLQWKQLFQRLRPFSCMGYLHAMAWGLRGGWNPAVQLRVQKTKCSWPESRSVCSCWAASWASLDTRSTQFSNVKRSHLSSPGNRGAAKASGKEIKPLSAPQETRIWNDQLGVCRMEAKTTQNLEQITVLLQQLYPSSPRRKIKLQWSRFTIIRQHKIRGNFFPVWINLPKLMNIKDFSICYM